MSIIFPSHCRNITSGALKQLKEDGFTSASKKPLLTDKFIFSEALYFSKREPAGVFMEKLESTKHQIDENTEAIQKSAHRLVESAILANKQIVDINGKFRDGTEKLGTAIDKLMKIVERSDFAETVKLTESLVGSLERLAVLEEKGLLDKVIRAMSSKS